MPQSLRNNPNNPEDQINPWHMEERMRTSLIYKGFLNRKHSAKK